METLFPIKINIPDMNDNEKPFSYFFKIPIRLNFLFTCETNIKEIKIVEYKKIFQIGEIIKENKKSFSIYYIEIFDQIGKDIEIKFLDKTFLIKTNDTKLGVSFLFNQSLFDKNNKKIDKLNIFDIYEEFEIYYRIHSEKKNMNSLKLLISSTLNYLKANKEESNFTLFLTLFIKEHSQIINNIDDILVNMKNKGDLKRISHDELYKIVLANKKNEKYMEIYLIYIILSQKTELINALLKDGYLNEQSIFDCLKKYIKIFSNSVQLFPKFTPLLKLANSFDKIESILKCSKDLIDFIYFINEEKELILKYIDEKYCLRIENFFDLEWAFKQQFDEDYYLALNNIREFEIKFKKNFFNLDLDMFYKIFLKDGNLKPIIFNWIFEEKELRLKFPIKKILYFISSRMNIEMIYINNFETIQIIDILSNFTEEIDEKYFGFTFIILLKNIKFEKLKEKIKPFFSKILSNIIDKILKNSKVSENFINEIISVIKGKVDTAKKINDFVYIFICVDKFIKEKDLNILKNLIDLIVIISNKYLTLLNEIKNEEIENENDFAEITSKLIYLNYKYGIKNEPLFSDKIGIKLLNTIYIIFLDKYAISDLFFEKLIIGLITKGKFGIIYNKLIEMKYFSRFEKLLKSSIIEFDELFEENN